jgi:hypothetical protein
MFQQLSFLLIRLPLRPNIQDVFLKVTDDITLAQGPAGYVQYAINRGLLSLTDLPYVTPLLTVMRIQTEANP